MLNTSHGSVGPNHYPIPFNFGEHINSVCSGFWSGTWERMLVARGSTWMHPMCSGCWTSVVVSLLEVLCFGGERSALAVLTDHIHIGCGSEWVQVSSSVLSVLIASPGVRRHFAHVCSRWEEVLGMDSIHECLVPVRCVHPCCMKHGFSFCR
jgi:hypothetical protein